MKPNVHLARRELHARTQLDPTYEDYLNQVDDPVLGTCQWVLQNEQYEWWKDADGAVMLWISANPGCGKSVMAKFLIAHLQPSVDGHRPMRNICYFFFKEGLEEQDNASSAVSALLHQLYTRQHPLIRHALLRYLSTHRRNFNSFSSLWTIFTESLQDSMAHETICVIDGLDECEAKSLAQLLKGLADLLKPNANRRVKLKLLLLSRQNNRMETFLCLSDADDINDDKDHTSNMNRRRLIGENESKHLLSDIAKFARYKIKQLSTTSSLPIDVVERLDNKLLAGADFTFLWISLVMQLIEDVQMDGTSVTELDLVLSTNQLDDLYERLLRNRKQPLKTRKVLYMVLAAVRPLTRKEMCVAIEDQQDHHPQDDERGRYTLAQLQEYKLNPGQPVDGEELEHHQEPGVAENAVSSLDNLKRLLHTPFANHLRQMCGHLVCIRNGKIYLVHQTARAFLLTGMSEHTTNSVSLETTPQHTKPGVSRKNHPHSIYRGLLWKRLGPGWRHSIRLKDANRYLLQVCTNYLSLFIFQPNIDREWNRQEVRNYLRECEIDPPRAFFQYSANHWTQHYQPVRQQIGYAFDNLLRPNNRSFRTWIFVHPSFTLEEEKLEPGAVWVRERSGPDQGNANQTAQYDSGPEIEGPGLIDLDFEKVLDHFVPREPGMDLYDEKFIRGEHYWHRSKYSFANDACADEEDDDHRDGESEESKRLPDRIQSYRRQHRKELVSTFPDMSNPIFPGGGNPLNSWLC